MEIIKDFTVAAGDATYNADCDNQLYVRVISSSDWVGTTAKVTIEEGIDGTTWDKAKNDSAADAEVTISAASTTYVIRIPSIYGKKAQINFTKGDATVGKVTVQAYEGNAEI